MLGCFRSGLDGEEKEWIARIGGRRALGLRGKSKGGAVLQLWGSEGPTTGPHHSRQFCLMCKQDKVLLSLKYLLLVEEGV
ncbi:hypothetical protein Pyn_38753 [Prunus yedoensis var. nudiflora]|uniref:Uncharacterized protein n=1 Tax=Prunus yedoensis var. nudiflora TaxID=2094558 RepID=A0A314XT30_PRUYE|nr:hypothetical protein Pyn_38753 [Prunus yedoensis var. nudiflora]